MKETIDFETMSLGDFIRHQDRVARELKRRFERDVALMFTDVVGSTAYFERHGDAAGRALVQRHLDLLEVALAKGKKTYDKRATIKDRDVKRDMDRDAGG